MDEYIKRFWASIDFEKRKELWDSKDLVTIWLLWYLYKNDWFNWVEHKKLDYLVALPKLGWPWFINNEKFLNILYSQSWKDEEQRTKEVNSIISWIKKARDTTTLRSWYNFQDKLRSVLTDRRWNRTK
jgi:hypothetical protein